MVTPRITDKVKFNFATGSTTPVISGKVNQNETGSIMFGQDGQIWVGDVPFNQVMVSGAAASDRVYVAGIIGDNSGPTTGMQNLYVKNTQPYGPYFEGCEFYNGSDRRLKDNIQGVSNEFVDELFKLDDVTYEFDWKDSGKHSNGFIAQDLLDIIPEAVDYNNETTMYSVNYDSALSKVVGALFKKVKQLEKEIEELKTQK